MLAAAPLWCQGSRVGSMSQQDVLNHSTGFLPHFDKLKRGALTDRELVRLYALMNWRVILFDKRIGETYQDFLTVNLFKALALPYLVTIPSERALFRELKERESLQVLCGFSDGKIPTRATLWHFRNKYSDIYPESMLRVLIALVLSGPEPNLTLPFVTPIPQTEGVPNGRCSKFQLDIHISVEVWTTVPETGIGPLAATAGKTMAELHRELREFEVRKRQGGSRKKGLASRLGLPAEVRAELHDGQSVYFGIDKPDWLGSQTEQSDTLTSVGPASFRPYTACSVLIIREHEDRRQVLLSRRLAGYGKGTYILPGGKLRPDESLQACAARELWEETGIRIREGRPVSLHSTRLPGKPRVLSVGVLAEDYEGEPKRREPDQNTEWQWFDLDKLPVPLFEPTHIAISHYINETYRNLQWSDVEAQVSESREPWSQLKLPTLDAVH